MYRQHTFLIAAVLILVAMNPWIDHLVTSSDQDNLDASSLFILIMPAVAAFWALHLKPRSLIVAAALVSLLGPVLLGSVHALTSPKPVSVLAESGKVFAGCGLLLLLPTAQRASLKRNTIRIFFGLLVVALLSHVVVAIFQVVGLVEFTYFQRSGGITLGRPSGSYFHPISLAFFCLFVMMFTNALADRHLISQRIRIILLIISGSSIILTTHRATFLIAIGTTVLYGLARLVHTRHIRMLHIGTALILLIGGAGVASFIPNTRATSLSLLSGLTDVVTTATFDPSDSSRFLRGRGERWKQTIEFISTSPVQKQLFGVGYQPMDPHSDYLRILLVNGWFGVIMIMLSYLLIVCWLWKQLSSLGQLHLFLLVTTTAIFSLTTKPSTYTFYMWLSSAFIIVLLQLYPRRSQGLGTAMDYGTRQATH